ncbi:MAG: hypothetical protein JNL11_10560 [Bdellovibrionaceae bacterium]|nr:hypothetical protein [Pseudobdellovibrionaceae bacterium]
MKALLITLTLIISGLAHADLADNAFAKVQYLEVGILDIQSVTSKIRFVPASPTNVSYYDGYIIVNALVEGNLCSAAPSSFGTLQVTEGKITITKLVAGRAWNSQTMGCLQYSKPTRVSFPVSIGWLVAYGDGLNQTLTYFKTVGTNQKLTRILINARASQIQVSVKK